MVLLTLSTSFAQYVVSPYSVASHKFPIYWLPLRLFYKGPLPPTPIQPIYLIIF